MRDRRQSAVALIFGSALIWAFASQAQEAPDVIFVDGKVVTVDADFSMAEAIDLQLFQH